MELRNEHGQRERDRPPRKPVDPVPRPDPSKPEPVPIDDPRPEEPGKTMRSMLDREVDRLIDSL